MTEVKIIGLVVRDSTDWKNDFQEAVKVKGCGVMWKDQVSNMTEILPQLNKIINSRGAFPFYIVANNKTEYICNVIDFATEDNYNSKRSEWKKRNPAWFSESFDDYYDEKEGINGNINVRQAKIAFLVKDFEIIPESKRISADLFEFFDKQPSQKNAAAFINILTNEQFKSKRMFNDTYKLLENNHNIILTGAPGTGKTYLAQQIAQQMIFGEVKENMTDEEQKQFNEQCGFVQFHPSYDYTDFVEGLRPINDENGNIGFERKDGVFKEFCARALNSQRGGHQLANFDDAYDALVNEIVDNGNRLELKTIVQKKDFIIRVSSNRNLVAIPQTDTQTKMTITKESFKSYIESGIIRDWKSYLVVVGSYLKSKYGKLLSEKQYDTHARFVFIIDEINRGEISKIFGELFFAIDPGYRGADKCNSLRTQYSSLQKTSNSFDETLKITDTDNYGHFFVPENVYIIGTMNDIDRSVESMDFAFRRRFAFKEIEAKTTQSMLDNEKAWKPYDKPEEKTLDILKKRMDNLNLAILKIQGLSTEYQIGAAYFLKFGIYGNYEDLWKYHLEGLLREYLRGMPNVDENLKELGHAYKLEEIYEEVKGEDGSIQIVKKNA